MFCTKCGKEIPDDSQFCKHCGSKVKVIADDSKDSSDEPKAPKPPEQEPASKRETTNSDDIDLSEVGRTVKKILAAVSAQVGATAKAKVKAVMEDSTPTDSEPSNKGKAVSGKKESTDKTEFAAVIISGGVIMLFFIFAIAIGTHPKDNSPSEPESTPVISADENKPEEETSANANAPRHAVRLFVEFESNWFFDKYGAEVSVDGNTLGTQPHGEDGSYDIELTDGEHTFSVEDTEGVGRTGSATFDATGLSAVGFNIDIGDDRIYIEPLDTVTVPLGPDEVTGKSRQEVEDAFRSAGFGNVTVEELGDLPLDQVGDADTVANVAVKGSDSFAAGDVLFPDDEIVISVHTPAKIKAPVSSAALLGTNYEEARAQLEAAGFTVECSPASFYDDDYGDWAVKEVAVDILFASDDFEEGAEFDYGTTIKLYYNETQSQSEPQADAEPDEWDQEWEARQDFEAFGEILYPYGFKCHWIVDLVTCEPQGDGTYFIKVGVTITNEYGAERRTYAQGIAGNGNVRDFWVS